MAKTIQVSELMGPGFFIFFQTITNVPVDVFGTTPLPPPPFKRDLKRDDDIAIALTLLLSKR